MTPAVALLKKSGIDYRLHEYHHDPAAPSYGDEAVQALGVPPQRVFKTLLISIAGTGGARLAVAIIPVCRQLDLKAAAAAVGAKKAVMAPVADAERSTGYLVGGISPLGQKRALRTLLDDSALHWPTLFVSGGRRGLEIELAPGDLQRLCRAETAILGR